MKFCLLMSVALVWSWHDWLVGCSAKIKCNLYTIATCHRYCLLHSQQNHFIQCIRTSELSDGGHFFFTIGKEIPTEEQRN